METGEDNIENNEIYENLKKNKTNVDIVLFNGLNNNCLSESIDDLIAIYEKIFDFACTLAGFQFVGLIFDKSSIANSTMIVKVSYFFF